MKFPRIEGEERRRGGDKYIPSYISFFTWQK